jgi:hypothetical protein
VSIVPTTLLSSATKSAVPAELHDDVTLDILFDAEELWAPERVRFLRDCLRAGVKPDELPQSIHWNWSLKAIKIPGLVAGPLSPYRMFGIKADGEWQGLLLAKGVGYQARIGAPGRDVVYVDFVESAPWNWREDKAGRVARFKGVGPQLIDLAIRWSIDLGMKGRVGLHSLPQADSFYRDKCGCTDLGIDPKYQPPLRYFEFTEAQALDFIGRP